MSSRNNFRRAGTIRDGKEDLQSRGDTAENGWGPKGEGGDTLGKSIVIIGSVAVIGLTVFWFSAISKGPTENKDTELPSATGSSMSTTRAEVSAYLNSASDKEVLKSCTFAVKGFMDASTPEERCQHILGGEARLSQLREFEARPKTRQPLGFGEVAKKIPNSIAGIPYWSIFASDQKDQLFEYILIPTAEGMKIDWSCSHLYGDLTLKDFTEQKPIKPISMRILVSDDPLRNVDGQFNHLIVRNPDPNAEFTAYFKDATGLGPLASILKKTGAVQNLHVAMVWNTDLGVAEITELKHLWWFDLEMLALAAPELFNEEELSKRTQGDQ